MKYSLLLSFVLVTSITSISLSGSEANKDEMPAEKRCLPTWQEFMAKVKENFKKKWCCVGKICSKQEGTQKDFLRIWNKFSETEKYTIAQDKFFCSSGNRSARRHSLLQSYSNYVNSEEVLDQVTEQLLLYGADPDKDLIFEDCYGGDLDDYNFYSYKLNNGLYNTFLHRWFSLNRTSIIWQEENIEKQKNLLQKLKNRGVNFNVTNRDGLTPLDYAIAKENIVAIRLLLEVGASTPNLMLHDWFKEKKRFHFSDQAKEEKKQLLQLFKEKGYHFNNKDSQGKTCLHYSMPIEIDDFRDLELLLEFGVDLSIQDNNGDTAFHYWGKRPDYWNFIDDKEMLQRVKTLGFDFNIANNQGFTPLHSFSAYEYQNLDLMRLLLELGADPNLQDNKGNTPAHVWYANKRRARTGDDMDKAAAFLQMLDEKNFDWKKVNNKGKTLLHKACKHIYTDTGELTFLLDKEIDPSLQDHHGNTAAHLIMQDLIDCFWVYNDYGKEKHIEIFDKLVPSVAHVANKKGITPMQLKEEFEQLEKQKKEKFGTS